jgi:hypothetical protein
LHIQQFQSRSSGDEHPIGLLGPLQLGCRRQLQQFDGLYDIERGAETMKPGAWLAAALALLAGVGIGLAAAPRRDAAKPAVPAAALSSTAPPIFVQWSEPYWSNDELRAAIRDVMREERKDERAESPLAKAPETTRESRAAHDRAIEILDAARGAKRWSANDVTALRGLMPQMTAEQREEVFHTLLPALNSGELVPEMPGMPF